MKLATDERFRLSLKPRYAGLHCQFGNPTSWVFYHSGLRG